MESANISFQNTNEGIRPIDILQQFINVFSSKECLNRPVLIKYQDRKYRLMCSEKQFMAFRINDNCGIAPGIPGWIVCIVDQNQIIRDSDISPLVSDEPSVYEWLHCIQENSLEVFPEAFQQ